jgi:hypothetical protein
MENTFRRYAADIAERVADLEVVYEHLQQGNPHGFKHFDRILSEIGIDLDVLRAAQREFRKHHPPEWKL